MRAPTARDVLRGFTLLELLLVITLMAAAAGLVAPRLTQWIDGTRDRAALDALQGWLTGLPRQSFFRREALTLASIDGPEAAQRVGLTLPPGWRVAFEPALRYEPNGMTAGATVEVHADQRLVAVWQVQAPAGRVSVPAPGAR